MGSDLIKFAAGAMDKGLQIRTVDFSADLGYDFDTYNVTHGIYVGTGPRYGFSTIPGMGDNETISGTRYPGLRAAEGSPAAGFSARLKVLGVLPISLGTNTTPSTKINAYLWILTRTGESIDMCVSSVTTDISPYIYDGFAQASDSVSSTLYTQNFFAEAIPAQAASRSATLTKALAYTSGKYYAASTIMSVTGADVPMRWYFGEAKTAGDATHSPDIALMKCTTVNGPANTTVTINCGVPSFFNLQNYPAKERSLNVYTVTVRGAANTQYFVLVNPSSALFGKDVTGTNATVLDIDGVAVQDTPVAGTPANTVAALVEDAAGTHNTSYKAALVASGKPFCTIFQDSYSASTIHKQQWIDLTSNSYEPPLLNTYTYIEEGVRKQSCFSFWPEFIRGTAMTDFGGINWQTQLGGANTGILRKNTVYEFTYSIYNKRLGFETNVGSPVKFSTGPTNDFVSLNLFYKAGSAAPVGTTNMYSGSYGLNSAIDNSFMPFSFSNFTLAASTSKYTGTLNYMNFTQYRFYYRQEGTFEWLPALVMDAAQFWFYNTATIAACTGPISALPGGQPGAFNDYSLLPQDSYNCVLNYKDRAWWFSEKAINFSPRNNVFAYPGRNSINAAGGSFRGGIVHNYPGQAQQSSRLVIFGSDTTYVARFTGLPAQTQVQISADNSATLNVDGSDLVIDPWTSVTAFSYRAASVADGILYWWGPQGIYRDDGVNTPTKISGDDLEPDIFTLYDPNKIDEIHAFYDEQTKDITWFYPPKTADSSFPTYSLVFNTASGAFLRGKFRGQVDWVSGLNVQTNIPTAGKRSVAGVRETAVTTIQRAYYFDLRNRSGDMKPNNDLIVKQISTVGALRRLTLAAGFDAANVATIVAGDEIALQQTYDYYNSLSPTVTNDIAVVSAVNSGAGTIDIVLPSDAILNDGSAAYSQYFPIWHKAANGNGLNGMPWKATTFYWSPAGINGYFYWLYTYLFFKFTQWKSATPQTLSLAYKSPTSPSLVTDTVTLIDNSDGNSQRYHRNQIGNENMEGQAIQYVLSGIHIGNEWVLQLLEAHNSAIVGDTLMTFEDGET